MKEYIIYNIVGLYALINMQDITIKNVIENAKNGLYLEGFYRE